MSEELRGDQVTGQRATVHRHERTGARRRLVNSSGDELLARPGRALNQDRDVVGGRRRTFGETEGQAEGKGTRDVGAADPQGRARMLAIHHESIPEAENGARGQGRVVDPSTVEKETRTGPEVPRADHARLEGELAVRRLHPRRLDDQAPGRRGTTDHEPLVFTGHPEAQRLPDRVNPGERSHNPPLAAARPDGCLAAFVWGHGPTIGTSPVVR